MPRTKREFVKIELFLFDDHRYFTLCEKEQLFYVKLLSLMKRTRNKIPKKPGVLIQCLRMTLSPTEIKPIMKRLKRHFPKLKESRWFYYFDDYEERYGDGTKRDGERDPKEGQKGGVEVEVEKEVEKEVEIKNPQEEVYEVYKKEIKGGARVDAIKNIQKLLRAGIKKEDLLARIKAYKQYIVKNKKTDPEYFIQANNFFGKKERWKEFEPPKLNPPRPDCKACKGHGWVFVQATGKEEICECRKK